MSKRIVTTEEYYTDSVLAKRLVSLVSKHYNLKDYQILEPSAGYGVFLSFLPVGAIGIDINPMSDFVQKEDYFNYDISKFDKKKVMVIGNPPFGARGSMAMKFLNRSMEFADVVAFILPRSFNKYTFQNRINENYKLIDTLNCSDFVLPDGKPIKIPCVFQIWKKCEPSEIRQKIIKKNSHPDFKMFHVHMSRISKEKFDKLKMMYPIAIPQVGNNHKVVDSKYLTKGSWWLIMPRDSHVADKLKRMNFDFLKDKNTFFRSLARPDIVEAYENTK